MITAEVSPESSLEELKKARFLERLWKKDAGLFTPDKSQHKMIRDSLGWLNLPKTMPLSLAPVKSLVSEVRAQGFERAVLLGMGGSSLTPLVVAASFPAGGAPGEGPGARPGHPRLDVLDTTNPGEVARLSKELALKSTLFIVSSKSGSTIEPNCLLSYFFERTAKAVKKPGDHFIAITDPGTSLEKLARKLRFRRVFLNPPDIGGRYSALSLFGLVPAALMGIDVEKLLLRAREGFDGDEALRIGAAMAAHARQGRDKLTLSLSEGLKAFELWLEQLIAESTGKDGLGVVPALEPLDSFSFGRDRVFVRLALAKEADPGIEEKLKSLESAGHPVLRLTLRDAYDLGPQFLLWEVATAAAGFLLGVNPFDQPDVEKAKAWTVGLLAKLKKGKLPAEPPTLRAGNLAAFCDEELASRLGAPQGGHAPLQKVLAAHLGRLAEGDYVVILAYLDWTAETRRDLEALRATIRRGTTAPVMIALGPRYLHSTGQLYKGGNSRGLFLLLTEPDAAVLSVPGKPYTLGTLHRAQARGDFLALTQARRRVLRLDLGVPGSKPLKALLNAC